jgi:hypothetical protein
MNLNYLHYLKSLLDLPGLNDLEVSMVPRFDVNCPSSLLMFIVQVHSSGSLAKFTPWFHVYIDPEVDPKVLRYHLLEHPRSGWFGGHHGSM